MRVKYKTIFKQFFLKNMNIEKINKNTINKQIH